MSIYENMDYFQIMLFTVTCWKFQKIQQPYIKSPGGGGGGGGGGYSLCDGWYICAAVLTPFFTRGQFWPSGIVITCVCGSVCVCVCVCINHELVRSITHHPVKLGSPNLDQRCKTPWFGSLLFWGWSTLIFKVKFNLKVKFYLILSLFTPLLISHSS